MAEIVKDLDFWRFAAMGQFIKTVLWGQEQDQEQWETLFEGTVEPFSFTVNPFVSWYARLREPSDAPVFSVGDTLRITAYGKTNVFVADYMDGSTRDWGAGALDFYTNYGTLEEYQFIVDGSKAGSGKYVFDFSTRLPDKTYLKIERAVK